MGNNVSKVLQDQYLKLCSLKVDKEQQQHLLDQLLSNLKSAEQNLASELTPDANCLSNYEQRVLTTCSDDSNQDLSQIGEFPRIKLAADIIDYAFLQVSTNPKIPDLLKLIIMSLKPSLFRLTLEDYRTLISESNPLLQTIDILVSYTPLWKDEQKANFPTFKKLVSLLDFAEASSNQLADKLRETAITITQIRENQQKRSLIFEKRLVEREASAAITKTSQLFITELLGQIKERYSLEAFLNEFLDTHWSRLLTLELVRRDEVAFIGSLELFIRLINSLADISSKQALNHLIDELPKLKEGLLAGLTKLAVSELEANEFLNEIESRHLAIIQQNSQLSNDDDSSDSASDNEVAPSEAELEKTPSIDEDDLIRLKPTDFYATQIEQPVDDIAPVENHQSNKESQNNNDQAVDSEEEVNSLASKTFLQAIEEQTQAANASEETKQSIFNALFSKMHNELSRTIFADQPPYASSETESYISLNDWYSIKDDNQLHKLIYIDENTKQHIFANQMAQKSYSFGIEEINQLCSDKQINKFVTPNIIAPAIKKSLQLYREFLSERKKLASQESAEVLDFLKRDSNDTLKNHLEADKSNSPEKNEVKTESKQQESVDIRSITVGSWISYNLNDRKIKCKLAARIVSKDVYIFVDRKGLKILEQTTQELNEKLASGKVCLVESENSGRLESVIAKTRNLKS